MAIGDGANDLLMLRAAGLGVAFKAKERVQREVCRPFDLFVCSVRVCWGGWGGVELRELGLMNDTGAKSA